MPTRLYLDMARLGRICPSAQRALLDFVRLSAEEGCSLYFERFLHGGFGAWPVALQDRYPGLCDWQGISTLQRSLRSVVGTSVDAPVLLANRSTELMRLGARMLVERCRRIVVTDLIWPSYRRILELERLRTGAGVTTVPLRTSIFRENATFAEVIGRIANEYERLDCDGLFLPAMSHDGIRLPLDSVLEHVSRIRKPAFVMVDGAQAFGHVPNELGLQHSDFFLAGCHKWLRAHLTMGLAFCPNADTADSVRSTCDSMLLSSEIDDPLLRFTREIEDERIRPFSETVSLTSLFTCQAALSQYRNWNDALSQSINVRLFNGERVIQFADDTGWQALRPAEPFRAGIVLLQVEDEQLRAIPTDRMRAFFLAHSIGLTCYDAGVVRLSMKDTPWRHGELDLLNWALRWFAGREEIQTDINNSRLVAI